MPRFLDMVVAGQVAPELIDDYVERWHREQEPGELHAYLGFTLREYHRWVNNPLAIYRIVEERRE